MDMHQEEQQAAEERMLEEGFNFTPNKDLTDVPPTVNMYEGLTAI